MRVISQDGTWDIPYDKVAIQRVGNKIYFLNANLMGVEESESDECIAKYSTVEKAINVIDSLRNRYERHMQSPELRAYNYFVFPEDSEV